MTRQLLIITSLVMTLAISGCATSPDFELTSVDLKITPAQVKSSSNFLGKKVLWGGTIIETKNQQDSTLIEVLAYPLNSFHRPLLEQDTLGRFLIKQSGYLEASHYAPGRSITVQGIIQKLQSGKIGNSTYHYPLLESKQLHLWKKQSSSSSGSFHFGIGIGL